MSPVLVTGAAGFIGASVCERLLARGEDVLGLDVFNAYYDPRLKEARAARLQAHRGFKLHRIDIADVEALTDLCRDAGVKRVVHLAAQAGVRYSIDNPFAYEHSNLKGHLSVLEACRRIQGFEHLVYASSSSVYGDRPANGHAFCESDTVDAPVSLYAATKRACELMSTSYAALYGLPQSGLRFFTVYGPWGRPDMAYFSFTKSIIAGETIYIYGEGQMERDFTYIDDIVDGVVDVLDRPPNLAQNRILNIGGDRPEGLMTLIDTLEKSIGAKAIKSFRPMQPGDVTSTWADVSKISNLTGYAPKVRLAEGVPQFVAWYRGWIN